MRIYPYRYSFNLMQVAINQIIFDNHFLHFNIIKEKSNGELISSHQQTIMARYHIILVIVDRLRRTNNW